MGKYNNVNGAYYHCAANGKDYSRDEWGKFCEDTRYTDAIVATYFGFRWNAHDVCLNPHTTEIYRDNRSFIEIKTAQRKDGLWTVGNSYQCLTGNCDDYGGGCGCWYDTRPRKMQFWQIWNGSRYGKTTRRKSKMLYKRQSSTANVSN